MNYLITNIIKIKPLFGKRDFVLPKSFVKSKVSDEVYIHKDKNEHFNYEWLFNTVRKYAPNTIFFALLYDCDGEHMFIFNETGMWDMRFLDIELHKIEKETY